MTMHTLLRIGIVLLGIFASVWGASAATQGPTVTVKEGTILGRTVDFNESSFINIHKKVDVFQGIPYAEPPVRFTPSTRKRSWQGVWNATAFTPSCSQDPHLYYPPSDEDCLYLNVYTPHPRPVNVSVMVWIHGGSFQLGTSMTWDYYGVPFVAVGDVVLVTLNYRLGIFSQFTTKDMEASGNLGMLDQVMALQWVNDNIEAFGGDSSQITIFGVSSGASSVGLHLVSELSRGLFQQAIMQSGTALAAWAFEDDPEQDLADARQLGLAMHCDVTNSSMLVSCLRTKPADELMRTADKIYGSYAAMYVDGTFLKMSPSTSYASGDFARVTVMAGFGEDEGTMLPFLLIPKYTGSPSPPFINATLFSTYSEFLMQSRFPGGSDGGAILDAVDQEYVDWTKADDPDADYFKSLVDLSGDVFFSCPADAVLRMHAEAGEKVYAYYNTHDPTATSYAQIGDAIPFTPWVGAGHGEELMFVFGMPFIDELAGIHGHNMTDDEKTLSVHIMTLWSNFGKSGDPSRSSVGGTQGEGWQSWPEYTLPELRYKELSLDLGETRAVRARQCHLHNHYIESLRTCQDGVDPGELQWKESFKAWKKDLENWRKAFADYISHEPCP